MSLSSDQDGGPSLPKAPQNPVPLRLAHERPCLGPSKCTAPLPSRFGQCERTQGGHNHWLHVSEMLLRGRGEDSLWLPRAHLEPGTGVEVTGSPEPARWEQHPTTLRVGRAGTGLCWEVHALRQWVFKPSPDYL